jgi:hypothetical protein
MLDPERDKTSQQEKSPAGTPAPPGPHTGK